MNIGFGKETGYHANVWHYRIVFKIWTTYDCIICNHMFYSKIKLWNHKRKYHANV